MQEFYSATMSVVEPLLYRIFFSFYKHLFGPVDLHCSLLQQPKGVVMKAFYSLSQPFDVEQLCLQGCFAIKVLSYRPEVDGKDQQAQDIQASVPRW